MWNRMLAVALGEEMLKKFKRYAYISGAFFIVLGLPGLFFPIITSISALVIVSYTMLVMGITTGVMTYRTNKKDWAGWLKGFILVVVSLLMIMRPFEGIAALGMLFAIYFFVDAFASFGLAFSLKPQKGWWLWLLNALAALALGVVFIIGWPFNSMITVGLFVAISFFFDGVALIAGAKNLDESKEENTKA